MIKISICNLILVGVIAAMSASTVAQESVVYGAIPNLLARLSGDWTMTGDVRGKPVSYRLHAGAVLNKTFMELQMTDISEPPKYEARVFIGFDPKTQRIIAHWIDSFGAAFSIPPGAGRIDGNKNRI
jgi:hypothetical protein